jgi:hypothetical protein
LVRSNNKPRYAFPKFIKLPKKTCRSLMGHNCKEFNHMNSVLPALYAQESTDGRGGRGICKQKGTAIPDKNSKKAQLTRVAPFV